MRSTGKLPRALARVMGRGGCPWNAATSVVVWRTWTAQRRRLGAASPAVRRTSEPRQNTQASGMQCDDRRTDCRICVAGRRRSPFLRLGSHSSTGDAMNVRNDSLWQLLHAGKATKEDQKEAARWIERAMQFVPADVEQRWRDGHPPKIPSSKKREP